jgi:hypothetical protein
MAFLLPSLEKEALLERASQMARSPAAQNVGLPIVHAALRHHTPASLRDCRVCGIISPVVQRSTRAHDGWQANAGMMPIRDLNEERMAA